MGHLGPQDFEMFATSGLNTYDFATDGTFGTAGCLRRCEGLEQVGRESARM